MRTSFFLVLLSLSSCAIHVGGDTRMDDLTTRLGRIEQHIEVVNRRLDGADQNFGVVSGWNKEIRKELDDLRRGMSVVEPQAE